MKRFLVPVYPGIEASGVFPTATTLARRKQSHLTGVAAESPFTIAAFGGFIGQADIVFVEQRAAQIEETSRKIFVDAMTSADIAPSMRGAPGLGFDWLERRAGSRVEIAEEARVFDLTIVALPGEDEAGCPPAVLDSCLFDSGRPVLVVPPKQRETFGKTIAIAWNGSSETARTILFGMGLLAEAERVVVIEVEGVGIPGPDAAALTEHLAGHGFPVSSHRASLGSRQHGQAFLEECEKVGADLMFKGAYTQSRFRQMIFGGATAYLLQNSTLPMFMAN